MFNKDKKLLKATNATPTFSLKDQIKKCKVVDIYDGDTCKVVFNLKDKLYKWTIRMEGYDTPEMRPPLSDPNRDNIKKLAILSKNYLITLINRPNQLVYIKCGGFDKYGRLLGKIYTDKKCENCVNDIMIEKGYGKPYDGKTKK
uniref:TNase-like domain-containing protein n=1 Tax=Megaviridae environmental sample TaxID=1737588 RepID=A0A5J6VK70_9VIRU|nr:MAG: hypothetical protein [Megaviridae environmental sample]